MRPCHTGAAVRHRPSPDYYDEMNSLFVDLQARYDALVARVARRGVVNIQATLNELSATWSQASPRAYSASGARGHPVGYTVLALVVVLGAQGPADHRA
jgi:hypothetical protein